MPQVNVQFNGFRCLWSHNCQPSSLKHAMNLLYNLNAHFQKQIEHKGGILISFEVLSAQFNRQSRLQYIDDCLLEDLILCFHNWLGDDRVVIRQILLNKYKGFTCSIHVLPTVKYDLIDLLTYQFRPHHAYVVTELVTA